jgi:hypothetical protein
MIFRVTSMTPKTFVSNISFMVEAGVTSIADIKPIPALLTTASIRPNFLTPDSIA